MESLTASDAEYQQRMQKEKAKYAVDTILQAEQHKKDKDLKPHIDAELKERHGHLKAAMKDDKKKSGKPEKKKEAPKKAPPAPKKAVPAPKKAVGKKK